VEGHVVPLDPQAPRFERLCLRALDLEAVQPPQKLALTRMVILVTVTFSMCPYRATCVMSQKASAALKYMSGVGADPSPPRFGPSSQAKVMWSRPLRLTVATFRNGVTAATSASKTISRLVIEASSPSGVLLIDTPPQDMYARKA
jgi:hypothetical protein